MIKTKFLALTLLLIGTAEPLFRLGGIRPRSSA